MRRTVKLINPNVVRQVAGYAKELTGGAFSMSGVGSDIGNGTRYIDGVSQLVWLGKNNGSRRACAYYYGAIETYHYAMGRVIMDLPEWLRDIRRELVIEDGRPFILAEMAAGADDANSRMRRAYGDDFLSVMSAPGFSIKKASV